MEKMGKAARLLYFEQDLTRHVPVIHLLSLLVLLGSVFSGDFFESVKLNNRSLVGAPKDHCCIGTLAKQAIELVLGLTDATDFEQALKDKVSDCGHLTNLTLLGRSLLLRRWLVHFKVKSGKGVQECRNRLCIVLHLVEELVLGLVDDSESHVLILC